MLQGGTESSQLNTLKTTSDNFNELLEDFYNNVVWRKLHALLTIEPLDASPDKIATFFDIPVEDAVYAIEGLAELGLLIKDGAKYKAGKMQFILPEDMTTRQAIITGHIHQSRQILNNMDETKNCGLWTTYLGASREDMGWFRKQYVKLIEELEKRSSASKTKQLFSITYSDVEEGSTSEGGQA